MVAPVGSELNIEIKTYPIRLRERGQITVPQAVREHLAMAEGDVLTLLQVGEVVLLTPKQPQVPQLADKIATMMEQEGVSLADLLVDLAGQRQAIWHERQQDA
ncbi:MAG: AbrB/MazE/SpoVT family DNA-binding domain-containing protein [Anaerolineales bacterium]|nr:AbrB/MazE/SpoVT family DNA-binding domain-containing protein [Anaerolineales bacterium]